MIALRTSVFSAATLVVSALLLLPGSAAAQSPSGFLFGRPSVHLDFSLGYAAPRARSDVFDFTSERLTLLPRDLRSSAFQGGIGYRISERLDLSGELGFSQGRARSEFRDWEDTAGNPIEQTTTFTRIPFTVTLRGYLWDRGRSVGHYTWVPREWTPYVGVGAGFVSYDFIQSGDFVDYQTLDIFTDRIESSGTAGTVHVLAGAELSLTPRLVLTGEGRYSWARASMGGDFQGFEPIDLSGLQAMLGLSLRL